MNNDIGNEIKLKKLLDFTDSYFKKTMIKT